MQATLENEIVDSDMDEIDLVVPSAQVDPLNGSDLQINSDIDISVDGTGSTKCKAYWTYELTIVLINKYKAHYPLFADAIHKNVQVKLIKLRFYCYDNLVSTFQVWDMIAAEFRKDGFTFNATQCENRWKYIRGKYIKKKDNASKSNTGGEYYNFEYFDEIDEILGNKPNVSPKFLVSSIESSKNTGNVGSSSKLNQSRRSRSSTSGSTSAVDLDSTDVNMFFSDGGFVDEDDDEGACAINTPNNKHKKKESPEDTAKRQDKYHSDMMEIQRESLTAFKDVMLKVLEEFKKK